MLRHGLSLICIKSYNDHNLVKIYQNLSKFGDLEDIGKLNFPGTQETIFVSRDQLRSSPGKKRKLTSMKASLKNRLRILNFFAIISVPPVI